MKKILSCLIVFVLAFACCSYFICDPVHAKKKSDTSSSGGGGLSLKLKARDGGTVVFGSVLNPKENEMKAKLPKKALRAIQNAGIDDLSIQITQLVKGEGDTSNIYTLNPSDSVDVFGKFLVINLLASLTDVAGSTYTAGALPEGNYDLTITAGDLTISGQFEYKPPVVVVGNVSSDAGCSGGTQQVTDLGGDPLGRTVALSNCSYFNEVQANRVTTDTKSRKLLHQESSEDEGDSSSAGDTDTEVEESEIAISEAIVTTDEGGIEELSAPIELNPDLNGDVQFDINENTTEIVNNALGFVGDDIESVKEVLKDEVNATSIEEIEGEINDIGDGDDTEFDPSCPGKFIAKLDEVSDNPSAGELLEFGRKLIDSFTNGDLVGCTPSFIQKIINLVQTKGDDGLIAFAKQFIFHVEEMENEFEGGGPDPTRICQELERGLGFLKECKGRFCPPPPCFPEGLRNVLSMACPNVLALVPEAKCEQGPKACGLRPNPGFGPGPGGPGGFGPGGPGFGPDPFGGPGGPGFGPDPFGGPGGPGFGGDPFGGPSGPGFGSTGFNGDPCHSDDPNVNGFTGPNGECVFEPVNEFGFGFKTNVKAQSIGGEEDCIEFKPPEPPSFCKPCATDDDCTGPKEVDPNSSCQLPVIACVSITDFDGVEKKVCHLNGPPKDPFSCREFPNSPNPAIQCLGPPPPVDCNIGGGRFDKRCCGGGGFGPPGFGGFGPGPSGPGFFRLAYQETEQPVIEQPATAVCGNSVVDAGEGCDDGNVVGGDGCTAVCQVETAVVVVEEPPTEEPSTGGSGVDLSDPLEALCAALAEKGLIQDDPRCEPFIGKFGGGTSTGTGGTTFGGGQPSGGQPTTPTTGGTGFGGQPGFGGGPKGMGGRPQPIDQCIRQIICSDVENNFGPGDFGTLRPETLDSAKLQCQEQTGGSTTDFPGGGATGGQFPGGGATGGQFPGGPGGFGGGPGPGGFGGQPGPGGFGPGPSGPGGFGGPDIQSCIDSCGFDPACEEKCKLEAGTFGSNEFGPGGFGPPPPPGGNFGPGGFPPPGGSFGFGPPPPGGNFGPGGFVDCSDPANFGKPECGGGQPPPPPDGGQPPPPPPQ